MRQLQLYGLQKGKLLGEPKVREMLAKLGEPQKKRAEPTGLEAVSRSRLIHLAHAWHTLR